MGYTLTSVLPHPAIGYSTNLIARDSNLIVIRGGDSEGRLPVHEQMQRAAEKYFPEAILIDEGVIRPVSPAVRRSTERRMSTGGVSSIVGGDNGERPGGFVLVIDGSGLGNVGPYFTSSLVVV
jgi:phospholipid-translocating ATPase